MFMEPLFGRPPELEDIFIKLKPSQRAEIDSFMRQLQTDHYSPTTLKQYRFYLIQFNDYTQKDLSELSIDDIKQFTAKMSDVGMSGKPIKHTTQKGLYSCLNSYFIHHKKNEFMLDRTRIRGSDSVPMQIFSPKEINEFFQKTETVLDLKWRAMFEFSYWEALRINDLIQMEVTNINFKNKEVFFAHGKGNKAAKITLLPKAKDIIELYLASEFFKTGQKYLFMYEYKKGKKAGTLGQYYVGLIENNFQKILLEMGIGGNRTFHSLRHSMGTHMMKKLNDLPKVQQHLRHVQGSPVTLRYLHESKSGFDKSELDLMGDLT